MEELRDLNIIKQVTEDLMVIDKYILEDKDLRVQLFEKGLLHYDFIPKTKRINDGTMCPVASNG